MVLIDVSSSNKEHYDPRNTLDRFLGIVKDKKVDLLCSNMSNMKVGDSISFNIEEYEVYRKGKLARKNYVGISPDDFFKPFEEVKLKVKLSYRP